MYRFMSVRARWRSESSAPAAHHTLDHVLRAGMQVSHVLNKRMQRQKHNKLLELLEVLYDELKKARGAERDCKRVANILINAREGADTEEPSWIEDARRNIEMLKNNDDLLAALDAWHELTVMPNPGER